MSKDEKPASKIVPGGPGVRPSGMGLPGSKLDLFKKAQGFNKNFGGGQMKRDFMGFRRGSR